MSELHLEVLDAQRRNLLERFGGFKGSFYLAGGTGLALQIGYRTSVYFDFFTQNDFSKEETIGKLGTTNVQKIQDEKDTLGLLLENEVKVSFMKYPYVLTEPVVESSFVNLASIVDIGCMKMSAIVSRSTLKDYVDLYFIIKQFGLKKLLGNGELKYPDLDSSLVLKSLVYFEDVEKEPIAFQPGFEVGFEDIKKFLTEEVKRVV